MCFLPVIFLWGKKEKGSNALSVIRGHQNIDTYIKPSVYINMTRIWGIVNFRSRIKNFNTLKLFIYD